MSLGVGGVIRFNTALVGQNSSLALNVSLHELGHAMGLDHNTEADVMYREGDGSRTNLTVNDISSFDKVYTDLGY
jgi:predicted Zn-dependent protease